MFRALSQLIADVVLSRVSFEFVAFSTMFVFPLHMTYSVFKLNTIERSGPWSLVIKCLYVRGLNASCGSCPHLYGDFTWKALHSRTCVLSVCEIPILDTIRASDFNIRLICFTFVLRMSYHLTYMRMISFAYSIGICRWRKKARHSCVSFRSFKYVSSLTRLQHIYLRFPKNLYFSISFYFELTVYFSSRSHILRLSLSLRYTCRSLFIFSPFPSYAFLFVATMRIYTILPSCSQSVFKCF